MTDRPTDDELRSLLERYRRPPEMPAESLWAAIEGSSTAAARPAAGHRVRPARTWLAAAVILFALGGVTGYAIAGAEDDAGPVPAGGAVAGDEGEVRVHRITWF